MLQGVTQLAPKREILSWAMFDFANSGYSTVVATAIFNAYFVSVIAGGPGGLSSGAATLLWTLTIAISNAIVLVSAPVVGSIADFSGAKKRFLMICAIGCALFTSLLSLTGPGTVPLAMTVMVMANVMYSSGENLVAAFLPEISPRETMGRVSAFGWTLGYIGGLCTLGICLSYVSWAQHQGQSSQQFILVTMLMVSFIYLLAATPSLLWLKERVQAEKLPPDMGYFQVGFARLKQTLARARQYQDLLRFLFTLFLYSSGTASVIFLAAVYAQQVMGFTTSGTITLIMVVNVAASVGAFMFGFVQDKLGSVRSLQLALAVWIVAVGTIAATHSMPVFWLAAAMIGIALGGSQTAGRALVGMFSPPGRSAEFFGLWGLAVRASAIIGPVIYGMIGYLTGGNQRLAIVSTILFFVAGFLMLLTVDEGRGKSVATTTQ